MKLNLILVSGMTLFIGVSSCSACGFNPKFECLDSDQTPVKKVSTPSVETISSNLADDSNMTQIDDIAHSTENDN